MTRKQLELLSYLYRRHQDGPVGASYDEMREALGLKSKSGVLRLLDGLGERGYIGRLSNRWRAVKLTESGIEVAKRDLATMKAEFAYSDGFFDCQEGLPYKGNGSAEYRAGWEGCVRARTILDEHGFKRQRDGSYRAVIVLQGAPA